ncbi:MAG: TraR/DksA family transcriptional regulator [Phycisphaerales bacterium]
MTKKTAAKKTPVKKTPAKAPAAKPAAAGTKAASTDESKATGRKGITIVKPTKKTGSRSRAAPKKFVMPERPMLLGPGSKLAKKPLIPSGPTAPKVTSVLDAPKSRRKKSPLTKAKLDKYRALLIAKRAELLGDVVSMENEALRSDSGGAGSTSNHLAEQGSENYDQSLSLNLAAQDRRLIKDIDDALARVEDGSFGLCELTGHPIPEARLDELPWARYTIEAARELERRGTLG